MSLWDLFSIVTRDQTCEDDDTTVAYIGKASYDLAKMYSEQLGFDKTFDSQTELRHDSLKTQFMEVHDKAKAEWPAVIRCPFRDWFDKIHAVKHAVTDEFHDDVHGIKHWWHHIMHKAHQKERRVVHHLQNMWSKSYEKANDIN
jgi:hypothetical protein